MTHTHSMGPYVGSMLTLSRHIWLAIIAIIRSGVHIPINIMKMEYSE